MLFQRVKRGIQSLVPRKFGLLVCASLFLSPHSQANLSRLESHTHTRTCTRTGTRTTAAHESITNSGHAVAHWPHKSGTKEKYTDDGKCGRRKSAKHFRKHYKKPFKENPEQHFPSDNNSPLSPLHSGVLFLPIHHTNILHSA